MSKAPIRKVRLLAEVVSHRSVRVPLILPLDAFCHAMEALSVLPHEMLVLQKWGIAEHRRPQVLVHQGESLGRLFPLIGETSLQVGFSRTIL